jgi:Fe-S-cluster-containing dehydrogenase component
MLIDLEKCVRCDDCVRACADTHGGNPRFVRQGSTFGHWMVANACMHCVDPVCMIGCPTGAIHRTLAGGTVVINDLTCIGCGSCANSCPYDNIRLVQIRERDGRPVLDPASKEPILKATKCDLCNSLPAGPACERACPHGALQRIDLQSLVAHAGTL